MTYKIGENEQSLWNDEDGLYYDVIQFSEGNSMQLPVRSLVGLIPLYATLALEPATINRVPGFKKRMEWFIDNRPEVSARNMANMRGKDLSRQQTSPLTSSLVPGKGERRLLALADKDRLVRILEKMLDEDEFLSEHGIRSYVYRWIGNPPAAHLVTGCRRSTRISHGVWTFMAAGMRSDTGLVTRCQECLVGTQTGVAQFGLL